MADGQESVDVDNKELEKVGIALADPPSSKDSLCKLLKQALLLLNSVSQSPHESTVLAMQPSVEALVRPSFLKHKDKDVRLLVATCISEVMRIVAPEAPYDDEILRDVFELIVASFKGLNEISSPHYERRVSILESVAIYRSCIVMLDLECEQLIHEMFEIFFMTVSESSKSVMEYMKTILCLVLNESEEIPENLLELLLGNLLREKDVQRAGYRLAKSVIVECSEKLRPCIEVLLNANASNEKSSTSRWSESIDDLIYEIYACSPSLLPAIPKLTDELLTEEVEVRLKAVTLLGRMFASQQGVSDLFEGIYVEYMKRFTDKAVDIRLAMVKCGKQCFLSNACGPKARDFISALSDRLQDFETRVRLQAVFAICDIAQANPQLALVSELKRVADRLRDKEVTVRQETQLRLMNLYKLFCSNIVEGAPVHKDTYYWIPSKLIKSGCDKDSEEFRAQGMELVSELLFPMGFPIKEIVRCWIDFAGAFDDNDRKAFHYILHQKQRLHTDIKNILFLREKLQGDEGPEAEVRMLALCKSLSNVFASSEKAEIQLHKFTQLKDSKLFKDLAELLDPNTSMVQSSTIRTNLLKRLGEKHPLYGFLNVLSLKCSYAVFGKEHMRTLLTELKELTNAEDERLLKASMTLLVDFTNHFPALLDGMEDELMYLLNKDIDFVKDGALQTLAKVGGSMRGRIPEESKSVNVLEDLCVNGSRKQAKYAVQALAAMSSDSGLTVFSALYRKLLDLLESSIKLPTILQSLGCIAQHAVSIFEAHEEDLVNFIVKDLFKRDSLAPLDYNDDEHHSVSEITGLKIFGIKTLVRSFLPNKDSQQLQRLKGLLKILLKFLESGEIADDIESSGTDKALLRLAAAKGVLWLSKRYDAQITPQLLQATVSCAKDCSVFLKRQFLNKVEKLLKERLIPLKYMCILPSTIGVDDDDFLEEVKQHLSDIVQASRRQVRHKDSVMIGHLDAYPSEYHPEYVLLHFVHVLASQADCDQTPSPEEVRLYIRQLYVFLWALLNQSVESKKNDERTELCDSLSLIYAIFTTLKRAEDVVDSSRTQSTYMLCDIGLAILKKLVGLEQLDIKDVLNVPVPKLIYRVSEETVEMEEMDGSFLPSFILDDTFFSQILPWDKHVDVNLQKNGDQAESNSLEKEEIPTKTASEAAVLSQKKPKSGQTQKVGKKASDRKVQHGVKLLSELSDVDEKKQALEQMNSYHEKATDMISSGNANVISPKKKRTTVKYDESVQKLEKVTGLAVNKRKASPFGKVNGTSSNHDNHREINIQPQRPVMKLAGFQKKKTLNMDRPASPKKIDTRMVSPKEKPYLSKETDDETLLSAVQKQKRLRSIDEIDAELNESKASSPKIGTNDKEATALDSPWKRIRISIKEPKSPQQRSVKTETVSEEKHRGRKMVDIMRGNEIKNVGAKVPTSKSAKNSGSQGPTMKKMDKDKEALGMELLNKKVLVYWPLDKRFYQGTISAYDAIKKLHDVSYDDGDKETLNLRKERWKIIEENGPDREDSVLTSKISKPPLQAKPKKHRDENKKVPNSTSIARPHKKAKPDANNLSPKRNRKISSHSDVIKEGENLDKSDDVPVSKQGPELKRKPETGRHSKVNNANDEQVKEAISYEPQEPDDNAPLIAWKPVRKKGQ